MDKGKYKKGFNYGCNLATLDKGLFEQLRKVSNSKDDFFLGMLEGGEQLETEKKIPEKEKTIQDKLIKKYSIKEIKRKNNKFKIESKSKEISKEK